MPKPWTLRRDDLLTREEWAQLRRHLRERAELADRRRTKTAIRNEAIVLTAVATGMRRSELAALDVGDLRLHNEDPFVIVKRGKGGKYREIPISTRFRAFLKRYLRQKADWREALGAESPVFVGERGRYSGNGIYRLFRKCCVEAGIRPLRVHAARHFLGAQLYGLTKDLVLVRKVLGHARVATTQVYVDLEDSQIREGLAKYDSLLSVGIPGGSGSGRLQRTKPTRRSRVRRLRSAGSSVTHPVPVAI